MKTFRLAHKRNLIFPIPELASILLISTLGLTFTLPPGPLCDEGMLLFMEGGCDWGKSNIFFFSKVGLLIVANLVLFGSVRSHLLTWRIHAPHFLGLAALSLLNADSSCDTYYSHPNGSIGQMLLEVAAFSIFGLLLMRRLAPLRPFHLLLAFFVWNLSYPILFYAYLPLVDHWTWQHTGFISLSYLVAGGLLSIRKIQ